MNKRLLLISSGIVLFLLLAQINMGQETAIFSDGFESGNFNSWDSYRLTDGTDASVSSDTARSGNFSLKFVLNDTNQLLLRQTANPPFSGQKEGTITFYLKVADGFSIPNNPLSNNEFFIHPGGGCYQRLPGQVWLWNDSGTLKLRFKHQIDSCYGQPLAATPLTTGVWHKISVYSKVADAGQSNGVVRGYIDDVLIGETITNNNNRSTVGLNGVDFIANNIPAGTAGTFYIDDVTVTATPPSSDITPPTVSITTPTSGSTVSDSTTVSATASDDAGVAGVIFFYDTVNQIADVLTSPFTAIWNTTGVANGSHSLIAIARDAAGNMTTSNPPVSVTVNNIISGGSSFYVDSIAGSDANAGTSRITAWRTLAKAYSKINDAAILGGDTIYVRPGVYRALDGPTGTSIGSTTWRIPGVSGQTRGGSTGSQVTFTVDTYYAGNVEITGALPGNWNKASGKTYDRTTAWTATSGECTANGTPWSCCTGLGTGCANIWYTAAPSPYATTGTGPGTCFQPGANPGGAPKMWEIKYSADSAPITMPTFDSGKNQCWIRPEYANHCTAAGEPYACCTAAGAGASCLGTVRVYAHPANGNAPDAQSPPVEMPVATNVLDLGLTGAVQYMSFTNNGNGRKFYWRWGTTRIITALLTPHITFEDFEIAYNSRTRPNCGSGSDATCAQNGVGAGTRSGSGFPRDTGGASYLLQAGSESLTGMNTEGLALRRGVFASAQGDEALHIAAGPRVMGTNPASCTTVTDCTQTSLGTAVMCASSVCYYHNNTITGSMMIEDVEFTEQPWEVANGDTSTYGYAYSWPPSGYTAWNANYSTHFSPLGGGGQSPGAFIIQSSNNVIRRIYSHDSSGFLRFENNMAGSLTNNINSNNLLEDSLIDGARELYAGPGGGSSAIPVCPTCKCKTASFCSGFGNSAIIRDNVGGWDIDTPGNIFRNNVIRNCYGGCFTVTKQGGSLLGRVLAPQFVNNTMQVIGDHPRTGMNNNRVGFSDKWGTVVAPGIIANNILVQDNAGTANTFSVDPGSIGTLTINYSLYGATNNRWKWGNNAATTLFDTWKSNSSQDRNSPSPAAPIFVSSPLDLHITASSPAKDTGTTIAGFSTDKDGVVRPQGSAWDIGAYEVVTGGPPPPATTATLTANPTSITSGQSSTLTWSSTNATSCTGTNFSTGNAISGSTQVSPITTTTTYTLSCADIDSSATANATVTVTAPIDNTAPILSNITSSNITTDSAAITWTTDEPATSQVEYGLATIYGDTSILNATLATTHSVSLSSLSPNTTYNYRIISMDAAGNTATSLNRTFDTVAIPDTQGPNAITDLSSSNIQQTSFYLSWTAPSDPPSGSGVASYDIRYSTSPLTDSNWITAPQATGEPIPSTPGTSQSYTIAGLSSGTTYHIGIKSQDSAPTPNISLLSNVVTQTTLPESQPAPPPTGGGGGDSGTIFDNTPPKTPKDMQVYGAPDQILITWTNPTDSDYVRTVLVRKEDSSPKTPQDGVTIYEGTSEEFTDTGLTEGKKYYYALFSFDRNKNFSSSSSAFSFLGKNTEAEIIQKRAEDEKEDKQQCVPQETQGITLTRWMTTGTEGQDVFQLQKYLNSIGFKLADSGLGSPGNETAYFGSVTQKALQRFQCAKIQVCSGNEKSTGYGAVGPRTRAALKSSTTMECQVGSPAEPQPPPVGNGITITRWMTIGTEGPDVKQLQKYLNSIGFKLADSGLGSPGNETAYFGSVTQKALQRFQCARNIVCNGTVASDGYGAVGPKTRAALHK